MTDIGVVHTCARCGSGFERAAEATGQAFSWCGPCRRGYHRERQYAKPGTPCLDCGLPSTGTRCRSCYQTDRRLNPKKSRLNPRMLREYDPATGKRPQGKRWNELRARVIAEESDCWLCNEPVDKTLKGSTKMAPSVDHVVPLGDGGDYWNRANCRLAHVGCNSKRGARMHGEKIAALSAENAELRQRVAELEEALGWTGPPSYARTMSA